MAGTDTAYLQNFSEEPAPKEEFAQFCISCGQPSLNSAFCVSCGQPIPKAAPTDATGMSTPSDPLPATTLVTSNFSKYFIGQRVEGLGADGTIFGVVSAIEPREEGATSGPGRIHIVST